MQPGPAWDLPSLDPDRLLIIAPARETPGPKAILYRIGERRPIGGATGMGLHMGLFHPGVQPA